MVGPLPPADAKSCKIIDKIAERYGHEVLRLPPYHCDLNAIEFIWANEKNFVARENTEMTMKFAEELFRRRRDELTPEICKKCVDHVKEVENSYWKTDRIINEKWINWSSPWKIAMMTLWMKTILIAKMNC